MSEEPRYRVSIGKRVFNKDIDKESALDLLKIEAIKSQLEFYKLSLVSQDVKSLKSQLFELEKEDSEIVKTTPD